jgi:AAA+ superfamily predicted ATPase
MNNIAISPGKFYAIAEVINDLSSNKKDELILFLSKEEEFAESIDVQLNSLSQSHNDLLQQLRLSTRENKNSFKPILEQVDDMNEDYSHTIGGNNFLIVSYNVLREIQLGHSMLLSVANSLFPRELILSDNKILGKKTAVDLQHMMFEIQLNQGVINNFVQSLQDVDIIKDEICKLAQNISKILESYYRKLINRHSLEGLEIFRDAIITDIAMSIYENVDGHGEIENGKNPDQISAYTLHKAEILTSSFKDGLISKWIESPGKFIQFIQENLKFLFKSADVLHDVFNNEIQKVKSILELRDKKNQVSISVFENQINRIKDLDPCNVAYREKSEILSAEESFNISFRNETLKEIVSLMTDSSKSSTDLIKYILNRKSQLKKYFQDENSFFVCKIGNGNPFTGEAPGGLVVVPGERPNSSLDDIVGSGFAEVKQFIQTIESASSWYDLFIATSPSKSADKSNVLLIGPPGAGKSEVFRAVASDKGSVGITAQGSDFLTCYKGEAEKNPKRLFEAGLKIQKESKKHVHFLIDEIDSVLKKREYATHGETDLSLEFQILMDGVVRYPNLSVWGATNSPEKIPMAMIRRFSKILIVGELSQQDRVHLLKQFLEGYLPVKDFNNDNWDAAAKRLEGATGDVIRKVIDHIWRTKMTQFVQTYKVAAGELLDHLHKNGKFNISNFNNEQRSVFKQKLGNYIKVEPEDLQKSINIHLKNIAVRAEIATAIDVYANARKFLTQINTEDL